MLVEGVIPSDAIKIHEANEMDNSLDSFLLSTDRLYEQLRLKGRAVSRDIGTGGPPTVWSTLHRLWIVKYSTRSERRRRRPGQQP
jgi:hypothetical protein